MARRGWNRGPKVSWSEYRMWSECRYKHKLIYIDRVEPYTPSKYMDFGTAIHAVAEEWCKAKRAGRRATFDPEQLFVEEFMKVVAKNCDRYDAAWAMTVEDVDAMCEAGMACAREVVEFIDDEYADWDIDGTEIRLNEPLSEERPNWTFKGFIDLVLTKGSRYRVTDWKSCGSGWTREERQDPLKTGQLVAYKWFTLLNKGIEDPDLVETEFVLVKRRAKNGSRIERVPVEADVAALAEVIEGLETMTHALESKDHAKTGPRTGACKGCQFYNTTRCPIDKLVGSGATS